MNLIKSFFNKHIFSLLVMFITGCGMLTPHGNGTDVQYVIENPDRLPLLINSFEYDKSNEFNTDAEYTIRYWVALPGDLYKITLYNLKDTVEVNITVTVKFDKFLHDTQSSSGDPITLSGEVH